MARHETASSKPDETSVANIENPTQAQDLDEFGGGWAGSTGGGGGLPTGMDYQLFEVTDLVIPSGTDWSSVVHEVGSFDVAPGQYIAAHSFFIEGDITGADQIDFATDVLPATDAGLTQVQVSIVAGTAWQQMAGRQPVEFTNPVGEPGWTVPVFLRTTYGPTAEDISVTARAAFLII